MTLRTTPTRTAGPATVAESDEVTVRSWSAGEEHGYSLDDGATAVPIPRALWDEYQSALDALDTALERMGAIESEWWQKDRTRRDAEARREHGQLKATFKRLWDFDIGG
jgi:hypothetical protein